MAPADQLTQDLWQLVMQHMGLTDRLRAALTSVKLHKASRAVTRAIKPYLYTDKGPEADDQLFESLLKYLEADDCEVTSLWLEFPPAHAGHLPARKLKSLDIRSLPGVTPWPVLQLGADKNGCPGVLGTCTGLTSFKLQTCGAFARERGSGLLGISSLVDLVELSLSEVYELQIDAWVPEFAVVPCTLLQEQVRHLTSLDLARVVVQDVHALAGLSSLRVLKVVNCAGDAQVTQPVCLTSNIAPDFALPPSLVELHLGSVAVLEPSVLPAALTQLRLWSVSFEGGGMGSGASLLAAVGGLKHLQVLRLQDLRRRGVMWLEPAAAAYTSLVSSRSLRELFVVDCGLPVAVWEGLFAPDAARRLPSLQRLFVREVEADGDNEGAAFVPWGGPAVSKLVKCAPNLRNLHLCLAEGASLGALAPLTALTRVVLSVDCRAAESPVVVDVKAAVQHTAALSWLRVLELYLRVPADFDDASGECRAELLGLTSLRGLQYAEVQLGGTEQHKLVSMAAMHKYYSEICPEGARHTDVGLQLRGLLLKQLLKASDCPPAITTIALRMATQQAEQHYHLELQQQQLVAEQRQQLGQQEARLNQQEQRTEELQQQVASLTAQMQQLLTLQHCDSR